MKRPPKGNGAFGRDLDVCGQSRAFYIALIWFIGVSVLSLGVVTSMAALGFRPSGAIWMFPAIFAGFAVIFGASNVALRIKPPLRWLVQVTAALLVLGGFLAVYIWLGGAPPAISQWWRVIGAWPEAHTLMITVFVISALLGWMTHPTLPFRAAIYATILVFIAVWMDFQGYYIVSVDGYDWLLSTSEFFTRRSEGAPPDGGAGFVVMLVVTLTAWLPIGLWAVLKRYKTGNLPQDP